MHGIVDIEKSHLKEILIKKGFQLDRFKSISGIATVKFVKPIYGSVRYNKLSKLKENILKNNDTEFDKIDFIVEFSPVGNPEYYTAILCLILKRGDRWRK